VSRVGMACGGRLNNVYRPQRRVPQAAVGFIVDGVDAAVTRDALETEIVHHFEQDTVGAKILNPRVGYAPTVGILVQCWA